MHILSVLALDMYGVARRSGNYTPWMPDGESYLGSARHVCRSTLGCLEAF